MAEEMRNDEGKDVWVLVGSSWGEGTDYRE